MVVEEVEEEVAVVVLLLEGEEEVGVLVGMVVVKEEVRVVDMLRMEDMVAEAATVEEVELDRLEERELVVMAVVEV